MGLAIAIDLQPPEREGGPDQCVMGCPRKVLPVLFFQDSACGIKMATPVKKRDKNGITPHKSPHTHGCVIAEQFVSV
jgi:hypothetical protein